MKKSLTKGIFLLFFSFVYIVTLKLFNGMFPELIIKYGLPITVLYLSVFFIEGLRSNERPADGFIQGFIGSLFGISVSGFGLFKYYSGTAVVEVEKLLEAWNLPFVGLTPYLNFEIPGLIQPLALQFLSLLLLIGLAFMGSLIGSAIRKK